MFVMNGIDWCLFKFTLFISIKNIYLLSHTPDRCSQMCCFTGSATVVQCPWSKLALSALLKGISTDFSPCQLRSLNQQPDDYWHNALTARLPATITE